MTETNEIQLSPRRSSSFIWVSILVFFFVGSPILAVDNLLHYEAPFDPVGIISAIWILVLFVCVIKMAPGFPKAVMEFITSFSRDRFVVVRHDRRGRAWLCFGCRLLGFTVWSKRIAVDSIEEVRLFQGQSSDMAGRDMNDWQPMIRYGQDGKTLYFDGSPQAHEFAEIDMRGIEHALLAASA